MSLVHLHLMLNHIPVVGALFLVVLFTAGLVRGNATLVRTALWSCVALAVIAIVTFLTGEPAEEAVEGIAGISEAAIERHEEVALVATVLLGAGGALSAAALWLAHRRATMPRWIAAAGLVGSLAIAGAMGVTANLGGRIRHLEIGATVDARASEAGHGERDDDR